MTQHGFTFIELIIVVAVIIVSTGISMASYNSFNQRQQLTTDAEKMIDVLNLARKKSIVSDTSRYTCAAFNGYEVSVTSSGYDLNLCCGASCSPKVAVDTYTFQQSIDVLSSQNVQFQPLNGNSASTSNTTVTLRNQSTNNCVPIVISSSGNVLPTPICTCGAC